MHKIIRSLMCLSFIGVGHSSTPIHNTVSIETPYVTLGDIFPMAPEDVASTQILMAPNPGQSVTLNHRWLTNVAQKHSIPYVANSRLDTIKLVGASDVIPAEDAEQIIKDHLTQIIKNDAFTIKLDNPDLNLHLPRGRGGEIMITAADVNSQQTRFHATIVLTCAGKELHRIKVNGRIQAMSSVPVLNRMIAKGSTIHAADIQWVNLPSNQTNQSTIMNEDSLIGAIAKRQDLSPGKPITKQDVHIPHMVTKNQAVIIHAASSFMDITAKGKVLESGPKDAYVKVMNMESGRIIHATVIGPQQVRVEIPSMQNISMKE